MKLDFLICGSANSAFFSQIAFFKLCLNNLGGIYANARVVAVLGDHEVEILPSEWRRHFDGIEVEWSSDVVHEKTLGRYAGRSYRRYELIRGDADLAILCDADVAVLDSFGELIDDLVAKPSLAGVIAHGHFTVGDEQRGDPNVDWPEISRAILGKDIDRPYSYTLYSKIESRQEAPFYINYGVFLGTPDLFREFHDRAVQLQPRILDFVRRSFFTDQITIALVCADLELPTTALSMRYNFPNDNIADRLYPEEMVNIIFMHYLRTHVFDRHRIFANETDFYNFMGKRMDGSNEIFRNYVYETTDGAYPFGSLSTMVAERDDAIAARDREIAAIYASNSWRWTRPLRAVRRMFPPPR